MVVLLGALVWFVVATVASLLFGTVIRKAGASPDGVDGGRPRLALVGGPPGRPAPQATTSETGRDDALEAG